MDADTVKFMQSVVGVLEGGPLAVALKALVIVGLGFFALRLHRYFREAAGSAAQQIEAEQDIKDQADLVVRTQSLAQEADRAANKIDSL